MAKKYVPSGYQIINLDATNYPLNDSGDITPTQDDEKILVEILQKGVTKPILICLKNVGDNGTDCMSFVSIDDTGDAVHLVPGINTYSVLVWSISFTRATNVLSWTCAEQ